MNTAEKQLKIRALKNGTVLDHIPSKQLFRVIDILGLNTATHQITFGINLESAALGKKGIVKISDRFFEDDELNKIALIAPKASINIIKNYEVVEKKKITIPSQIIGIARCMNPMCVTNKQNIKTKFSTIIKDDNISLLCYYCEKITNSKNCF